MGICVLLVKHAIFGLGVTDSAYDTHVVTTACEDKINVGIDLHMDFVNGFPGGDVIFFCADTKNRNANILQENGVSFDCKSPFGEVIIQV